MRSTILLLTLPLLAGCTSKETPNAVEAFSILAKSAKAIEKHAEENSPTGTPGGENAIQPGAQADAVKTQMAMVKALGMMQGGIDTAKPVVNWRQLQGFLPDTIGAYKAKGDLDGRSVKTGAFDTTVVNRKYSNGVSDMSIEITDAAHVPALLMPFRMAALINEDSTSGYRKGMKLKGHQGIVSWRKNRGRSEVTLLVEKRYVVKISAKAKANPDEAKQILDALDIEGLAKVTAPAPAPAPAP